MEARSVSGRIIFIVGIILSFISFLSGVVFVIVGLIIALNKAEDKIEKINYKKVKGGK